jgi:hypothetical protein
MGVGFADADRDVMVQGGEEAEEALHGMVAEVAAQQAGDVWQGESQQGCGLGEPSN